MLLLLLSSEVNGTDRNETKKKNHSITPITANCPSTQKTKRLDDDLQPSTVQYSSLRYMTLLFFSFSLLEFIWKEKKMSVTRPVAKRRKLFLNLLTRKRTKTNGNNKNRENDNNCKDQITQFYFFLWNDWIKERKGIENVNKSVKFRCGV